VPVLEHRRKRPVIDPEAYVAPTAVVCGDVQVRAGARILFGAVLTAEDGRLEVGERCVVMENALVRARRHHPAILGDDVLVGPHAHVNGAVVGDGCFLATGCSLFPGVRLGPRCEIRINAVVHVNSILPERTTVPIGWVAVGDPAELFPPDRHDDIWAIQKGLEFTQTVYGVPRGTDPTTLMRRQSEWFGAHREDSEV
jgi:carbonic anhydrase/acetyltransferase-like protein (isoleucine patch superfamily)